MAVKAVQRSLGGLFLIVIIADLGAEEIHRETSGSPSLVAEVDSSSPSIRLNVVPEEPRLLNEAIALVRQSHDRLQHEINDYTCKLVFRMRVDGILSEEKHAFAKVRHEKAIEDGISLYLKFDSPASVRGREVLFSNAGKNDRMLVRRGGPRLAFLTMELEPTCTIAMTDSLYPITEFGLRNLSTRMLECAETELNDANCKIAIDRDASLDGRACTMVYVVKPEEDVSAKFHQAKIYFDHEHRIPIRYEAYGFPDQTNTEPLLIEEYTYRDLQFNVSLSDDDFDRENAEYRFSKRN